MDAPEETVELDTESAETSNKTWIIIISIVIVTLIAIWLVPSEKETPPEDIPLPGQTTSSTSTGDTTTAAGQPGTAARAFIQDLQSRNGTPDEAFIEALRQQSAGSQADAYLLYFYAARNGHADASLVLGEQADPAYFSTENGLLEAADSEQAYKWYSLASAAGSTMANDRLSTLIETVETSANAGDEQAQRLMLQWN